MKKRLTAIAVFSALQLAQLAQLAYAADISNGRTLVERNNCAACHGANFNQPISPDYPKLGGQHADYLYFSMRAYQIADSNPLVGRNHPIMQVQVQNLSQSDLLDIAAYIESLPGDLTQKR